MAETAAEAAAAEAAAEEGDVAEFFFIPLESAEQLPLQQAPTARHSTGTLSPISHLYNARIKMSSMRRCVSSILLLRRQIKFVQPTMPPQFPCAPCTLSSQVDSSRERHLRAAWRLSST